MKINNIKNICWRIKTYLMQNIQSTKTIIKSYMCVSKQPDAYKIVLKYR